jgi:tRNA(fMet)-specific endonuclease VapC
VPRGSGCPFSPCANCRPESPPPATRSGGARLEQVVQYIEIVDPCPGFATLYGESAAEPERRGRPVPSMDLLIATLARAEAEPILTRDAEHFARVPGVTVERY